MKSPSTNRSGAIIILLLAVALGPTEVFGNTLPPESALLHTVAPGAYTAIVRGKLNTTGVGLVEVYNLP